MEKRRRDRLSRPGVPDPRGFVLAGSDHATTIRTERGVEHAQLVRHWWSQWFAGYHIPNSRFARAIIEMEKSKNRFTTRGNQALAIRAECGASDFFAVLQSRRGRGASMCIPNPCRVIFAGRGHQLSIRTESRPPDFASMLQRRRNGLAGVGVPNARSFVLSGRDHQVPVGAEGGGPHSIFVAQRRRKRLSGDGIPNTRSLVFTRCDNPPTIGTKRGRPHIAGVLHGRREWSAGAGVPDSRGLVFTRGDDPLALGAECGPNNVATWCGNCDQQFPRVYVPDTPGSHEPLAIQAELCRHRRTFLRKELQEFWALPEQGPNPQPVRCFELRITFIQAKCFGEPQQRAEIIVLGQPQVSVVHVLTRQLMGDFFGEMLRAFLSVRSLFTTRVRFADRKS